MRSTAKKREIDLLISEKGYQEGLGDGIRRMGNNIGLKDLDEFGNYKCL